MINIPEQLVLERLVDDDLDVRGQHVTSRYVEKFWLPTIGPACLWLLRHASYHTHGMYAVDAEVLAASIGLRVPSLERALTRLVTFDTAHRVDHWCWRLRTHLPPLSRRALDKLPAAMRDEHEALLRGTP